MAQFIGPDNQPVREGDTITDFRGMEWTFHRVARLPGANYSGRVEATRADWKRELYPDVFPGYRIEA